MVVFSLAGCGGRGSPDGGANADSGVWGQADGSVDVGDGGGSVPTPSGPSSYQLLEAAVDAGALTEEQGLVYKLGIDFGWPPVPPAYHGDDMAQLEGTAVEQMLEYIARVGEVNVAPSTLEVLGRCQAPPYQEGSWWNQLHPTAQRTLSDPSCDPRYGHCGQLTAWDKVEGENVIVWYLKEREATDYLVAASLSLLIESEIWVKLTGLMQKPRADLLWPGESDPRLDIILTDNVHTEGGVALGLAVPLHTPPTPVKLYIDANQELVALKSVAAHELMHACQFAYATKQRFSTLTSVEATATWATNYVYPDDNFEQPYAPNYLAKSYSTRSWHRQAGSSDKLAQYGAYVLPLYLEKHVKDTVIPKLWTELANQSDELVAIDAVLKNDFKTTLEAEWKGFVAAAWNRVSLNFFRNADKDFFKQVVVPPENERVAQLAGGAKLETLDPWLPPGAMAYFHLSLSDPNQRSVTFLNGWTFKREVTAEAGGPSFRFTGQDDLQRHGLGLQLLLRVNNSWQAETIDVTNWPWFSVCRDTPAGNITEVVVMFSNAATNPASDNSTMAFASGDDTAFFVSNVGCKEWTGSLNMSRQAKDRTESLVVTNAKLVPMTTMDAPRPPVPSRDYPLTPGESVAIGYGFSYMLQSGQVRWRFDEKTPGCSATGNVNTSLQPVPGTFMAPNWAPIGPMDRGILFVGFAETTQSQFTVDWSCVNSQGQVTSSGTRVEGTGLDVWASRDEVSVDTAGQVASGTPAQVVDTSDPKATGTWSLQASP